MQMGAPQQFSPTVIIVTPKRLPMKREYLSRSLVRILMMIKMEVCVS